MEKQEMIYAVCFTVGFCALMTMIVLGMRSSNEHYYRTASECIAKGNTWIPNGYGMCLGRQ